MDTVKFLTNFEKEIEVFSQNDVCEFFCILLDKLGLKSVEEVFTIHTITMTKCSKCSTEYVNKEVSTVMNLPLHPTLKECIDGYMGDELTDEDWKCDKCKEKSASKRRHAITKMPKIIVFCLNRFDSMGGKKGNKVTVPYAFNDYHLCAIACHFGSSQNGHYYAIRKCVDGKWFRFDDDDVAEIGSEVVASEVTRNGYMLFYKRNVGTGSNTAAEKTNSS